MHTQASANHKTLYALVAITVVAIAFGIFYSLQNTAKQAPRTQAEPRAAGAFAATNVSYDFGKISMAAGKVSHKYWISNSSAAPVTINKIFTSCMCTEASLITPSGKRGPFGMPGHGSLPTIYERMAPGQTAQVEVVFDPAAHGPAGVGPVDRIVTIEHSAGEPLELRMVAVVTP